MNQLELHAHLKKKKSDKNIWYLSRPGLSYVLTPGVCGKGKRIRDKCFLKGKDLIPQHKICQMRLFNGILCYH